MVQFPEEPRVTMGIANSGLGTQIVFWELREGRVIFFLSPSSSGSGHIQQLLTQRCELCMGKVVSTIQGYFWPLEEWPNGGKDVGRKDA